MNSSEIFDEKAKEWDKHPVINENCRIFTEEIRKNISLSSDMNLLEFGCGTGLVSMNFYSSVRSLIMTDTSQGMLDVLKQKIKHNNINNMELHCEDIFNLELPKQHFDLIYTLMALHHVADIKELLDRFHKLLKPGGYFCIGDLEPEDGSFHGDESSVHNGFDTSELKNTVEETGFEVTKAYRMHIMKKPDADGNLREYPMFFMSAKSR
ncbi:class I SAM-dependent methyltransferase [Desulfonema magnum]|uniref:Methyltransferase domain-containing protein n=1 Tax=Desulfonema magnum TaxID=45655 RepID=A0A975BGC1_9BACT|nr:class I SAM-dependent methyltransferase [Desulfonema magnum]QTA84916.1 Methyltransferase domain-containing protein [Desulfonema magnum]